jgi:hypothetical protein
LRTRMDAGFAGVKHFLQKKIHIIAKKIVAFSRLRDIL